MSLIGTVYDSIVNIFPNNFKMFPLLAILSLGIAIYSAVVWMFYKILAKKNILKLDLDQYNNSENATIKKIAEVLLYIAEFLLITPVLITLWFIVFTALLLLLAKDQSIPIILLISTSFIAAIRLCAYFNEDLSNDLAKMFPFTLLGIAILTPDFFDFGGTIARATELGKLLVPAIYNIIFIFAVEIIARIISLFNSKKEIEK